ncbi:hypothetical protein [Geodermatophilus tzadiensis]|nr:hypothetical protein [Geodermatophilus tzadiensis]
MSSPVDKEFEAERFELLSFTYNEVLAATKHQDEKINKLLTAIAFLVAGALALANLADARFAMRLFELSGSASVPLILLMVGVFLVGVLAAVVMLIGTMTSPLRFPGGSRPDAPAIPYVTGLHAGQVYFNEIASGSLAEWHRKWHVKPAELLLRERNESLVRETHNLAVRAEYKYARTSEAVAVLSFALLSFASAAVLLIRAAVDPLTDGTSPASPVPMDWRLRVGLAAVLLGYGWLQLRNSVRGELQSVADLASLLEKEEEGGRREVLREQSWIRTAAHPLAVALVPAWFVLAPADHWAWVGIAGAVALPWLAWWLLSRALAISNDAVDARMSQICEVESGVNSSAEDRSPFVERSKHLKARQKTVRRWTGAVALIYVAAGSSFVYADWYPGQLLLALAGSVSLLVSALVATATRQRRRVDRYEERRDKALAAAEGPDAGREMSDVRRNGAASHRPRVDDEVAEPDEHPVRH